MASTDDVVMQLADLDIDNEENEEIFLRRVLKRRLTGLSFAWLVASSLRRELTPRL